MRLFVRYALAALVGLCFPAGAAELTAKERAAARKLDTTKCAKCHQLYHPAEYPPKMWDEWMEKMTRKSKLKPAQGELLARFFAAQRAEGKPVRGKR